MAKNTRGISRRGFLGSLGAIGALGSVGVTTACAGEQPKDLVDKQAKAENTSVVPFDGKHQAGVTTPPQAHNMTVAFSLRDGADKKDIQRLLRIWTDDARRLCEGTPVLADLEPELAASPADLTITCGFGSGLYKAAGITHRAPTWLKPLPNFTGDKLDESWGERDLVLQICGNNRTTVSHALRVLVRGGADYARPSWSQVGFLDLSDGTPRNLFGFKDGTINPTKTEEFDDQVWNVDGGTCMVIRRIAFDMPKWESVDRNSREVSMGRTIVEGAPLSGGEEFDLIDPHKLAGDGLPYVDPHSHVALAAPRSDKNDSADDSAEKMLRRPYNYDLPVNPGKAGLADAELIELSDSGMIFISFQKDPATSFIPVQKRLAEGDRLNEWITHVGSAVFHIPGGTKPGGYWGEELFA